MLTVGDGDFSFSLARLLFPSSSRQSEPESSSVLIATSYESLDTLKKVYPAIEERVGELTALGAQVRYQVDATRLADNDANAIGGLKNFDRVVWNFPCTAIGKGQDGQNDAMEENKGLVRAFVSNASKILRNNGEMHMCHKTKPPFNQWDIQEVVRSSVINEVKRQLVFKFTGRVVLDRATLPPYTPRKALDRKSFPCHDACTFIFQLQNPRDRGRNEAAPTISEESRSSIVPVTSEVILQIRKELMHIRK